MLIVREVFTAKPGQASKLAAMLKDLDAFIPGMNVRVLTDAIGPFNTVVLETAVADLGEFEAHMREYATRADIKERLRGYTDLWTTGTREVYRVV